MKWKTEKSMEGEQRVKKKFCIFPTEISGTVYWLESITVKQVMTCFIDDDMMMFYAWKDVAVLENKQAYKEAKE